MSTRAGPPLSIGLPVFNGEAYLEETLRSIGGQSFGDYELIISDNASTDRTEEICRTFAARDDRIRYHRSDRNLGAAPNYNRTFRLASGRYFKWLADDDLYEPTFLERCLEALEADPGVVLAYAQAVKIDARGELLFEVDLDLHPDAERAHERFRYLTCINHPCLQIFGVARAEVLGRTPLIGSYVGSDRVLLAELALHGRFHEIPERLFLHREHPRRSTRALPDLRSRAAWFDTRGKAVQRHPNLRIFLEYLGALRRAPLGAVEKLRCHLQLVRWWKHNGALVAGDLSATLREWVSGADPGGAGGSGPAS